MFEHQKTDLAFKEGELVEVYCEERNHDWFNYLSIGGKWVPGAVLEAASGLVTVERIDENGWPIRGCYTVPASQSYIRHISAN